MTLDGRSDLAATGGPAGTCIGSEQMSTAGTVVSTGRLARCLQWTELLAASPASSTREAPRRRARCPGAGAEGHRYGILLVPKLWKLRHVRRSRIFQDLTVPEIVVSVVREHDVECEPRLSGDYQPREYCVQYRESDFSFVSRLMEEEGIFYFFEHTADKHTLVLANAPTAHQPCPNQPKARYGYMTGGNQDQDMITH